MKTNETFTCAQCATIGAVNHEGAVGYGIETATNRTLCYDCCAANERKRMIETGKGCLYLTGDLRTRSARVTDWAGKLAFHVTAYSTGRHNIARVRYDVRFTGPDGREWSGTQYGDNTQICHVRRLVA